MQGIDDLPPVSFSDDESEVPEHPQLLGDGRLLHLHLTRELADRARPGAQPAQDPNTARRRQGLHRLGDRARRVGRDKAELRFVAMTHARIIA